MTIKITEALVGMRVLADDSFSLRAGTVAAVVSDRWGTHAVVNMDNGSREQVCSFVAVLSNERGSRKGIGWYLVEGLSSVVPGPSYTPEDADELARERATWTD